MPGTPATVPGSFTAAISRPLLWWSGFTTRVSQVSRSPAPDPAPPWPRKLITPHENRRGESGLIGVATDVATEDTVVELSLHHDIWAEDGFFGRPHPEIHKNNAPRLAQAWSELEAAPGKEAEAGTPPEIRPGATGSG